ncbi:hypothetical protein AB4Z22_33810 [Paenibacillus sp. TAF58]
MLRGTRYEVTSIRERLSIVEVQRYFGALDLESFVALMMLN